MSQENPISKQPLIRYVNRQQMGWRAVEVEHLIGEDHPARAIWALLGQLNLSGFYQAIESSAEEGGRPAFAPQLRIRLWVYAYSQGMGSAREVARRCDSRHKNQPARDVSSQLRAEGLGLFAERLRRNTWVFALFMSVRICKSQDSYYVFTTVAKGRKRPVPN